MKYLLKGNLRGFYCGDCFDYLNQVRVKAYAAESNETLTAAVAVREKETFHERSAETVKALENRLLAVADTDENGNFSLELSEKQYKGGAIELDFECGSVPLRLKLKRPPVPPRPLQFHLGSIQPLWKENFETQTPFLAAYWENSIAANYWCRLLQRLGLYVICGRVLDCESKTPLRGLVVKAFDVDLIQDDALGQGTTQADGSFRIYYTKADFSKTIFPSLNIEWPAGPDLYFSIETASGSVLLREPRKRGHEKDRENAGNCFCVDFCLKAQDNPGSSYAPAIFQKVGQYSIASDFDASGFSNDAERNAFTGNLPLIGAIPAPYSSTALEYRFRVRNLGSGVSQIVDANLMGAFRIGTLNRISSGFVFSSQDYWVNNAGATHNVVMAADGWITVPRENALFGSTGQFAPGEQMGVLLSEKLVKESFNLIAPTTYVAGQPFPAAQRASVHTFEIVCEVREVGSSSIAYANVLSRIAICNTEYLQRRHPNWAGGDVNMYPVVMLELGETTLSGAGCNRTSETITAVYSAVHPMLERISLSMEGNGVLPPSFSATPLSPGESIGAHPFDIRPLDPCAYIVWLSATFRLSSGYGRIPNATVTDHIAFCKA